MSYPGWGALLPCCGAALVIASHQIDFTYCGQLLSLRWVTSVGKMSYALYLWHWPIYVLLVATTDALELKITLKVLCVFLTFIAASFSHVWVEPYFRSESKVPSHVFLKISCCTWLTLMIIATVASATDEVRFTSRSSTICDNSHQLIEFLTPALDGGKCLTLLSDAQLSDVFLVNASEVHAENLMASKGWTQGYNSGILHLGPSQAGPQKISAAFIGDSHCQMYIESLTRLAEEYDKAIIYMCKDATLGTFSQPISGWDETRLSALDKWQPERVVWIEFWGVFEYHPEHFEYALNLLLKRTREVIIFGDVPTIPFPPIGDASDGLAKAWALNQGKKRGSFTFLNDLFEANKYKDLRLALEKTINRVASNASWHGRVKFVPVDQFFLHYASQKLMLLDPCNSTLVYKDFGHLNAEGARRVEPLLRKEIFGQAICNAKHEQPAFNPVGDT